MGTIQGDPSMAADFGKDPDSDIGKIWSRAQSGRASTAEIQQLSGIAASRRFDKERQAKEAQAKSQQDFMKAQEAQMKEATAFNAGKRLEQERAAADEDKLNKRGQMYEDLMVRVEGGQATPEEIAKFNVWKSDGVTPLVAEARKAGMPFKDYLSARTANDARTHQRAIEDITRQTALLNATTAGQNARNNAKIPPGTEQEFTPVPGQPSRVFVYGNDGKPYDKITGAPLNVDMRFNPMTGEKITTPQPNPFFNAPTPDQKGGAGGELPSKAFDKGPTNPTNPKTPGNPNAQLTPKQQQKIESLAALIRSGQISEEVAIRLMANGRD